MWMSEHCMKILSMKILFSLPTSVVLYWVKIDQSNLSFPNPLHDNIIQIRWITHSRDFNQSIEREKKTTNSAMIPHKSESHVLVEIYIQPRLLSNLCYMCWLKYIFNHDSSQICVTCAGWNMPKLERIPPANHSSPSSPIRFHKQGHLLRCE